MEKARVHSYLANINKRIHKSPNDDYEHFINVFYFVNRHVNSKEMVVKAGQKAWKAMKSLDNPAKMVKVKELYAKAASLIPSTLPKAPKQLDIRNAFKRQVCKS